MSLLDLLAGRRRRPPPIGEPPAPEPAGIGPPTEKDYEAYREIAANRPAAAEGRRAAEEALRLVGPMEAAYRGGTDRREAER